MSCTSIPTGSAGVIFRMKFIDCDGNAVDVSDATDRKIKFVPASPSNAASAFEADAVAGDAVNEITYTTEAGDFEVPCVWNCQGTITTLAGTWKSAIATFTVYKSL